MLHRAASVTPHFRRGFPAGASGLQGLFQMLVRLLGAMLLTVVVAACASQPRGQTPPASGTATVPSGTQVSPQAQVDPSGPVTVAFLVPTTASSEGARRAAQDLVAAAQMAKSDLAPGNMILKVYDTRGTDAGAAEAGATAVRDGAALILGPLFGSSARAVAPVAAGAGLNVLAFSNDSSVAGGNVWVLGQLPDDEMRRLFSYASSQGIGTIALAYPTDPYGLQVAAAAGAAGRDASIFVGPTFGYERSFNGIEAASQTGASDIRGGGAQGVLIADAGDALRSMAAFLSYYDVSPRNVQYMGLGRWNDPRNMTEGALRGGWFVAADPSSQAAFDSRFSAQMGRRAGAVAGIGYDAVAVAATLLRSAQAGTRSPFDAIALTGGAGYQGATGPFRLTSDGLNRRSLAVMQIGSDAINVLDPAPIGAGGS
jgi:hypothetical protein